MKALVFGAQGQVGRALASVAPQRVRVLPIDRAQCDIGDRLAVEKAIVGARPDVVFNAAAYTAVDRAETEPDLAVRINAAAPKWIAAAARSVGARNVHISTDFVFDGLGSRPYRPDDATAPLGVYGQTKLDGEKEVLAADPDALIVRTAWVYAASGNNFMNTMLRLMHERDIVAVVDDQFGTPTYAGSLASALWALNGIGASGIHHFTDAGVATWYDFAVAIAEEALVAGLLDKPVAVKPIATEQFPTAARRPPFSVLDKSATWSLLRGSAPHWRTNLRIAMKALKDHG